MAGGAQFRFSGSRQLAVDRDTGMRLSGAPRNLLKFSWTTPIALAGASLGLNGQYVGTRLTRSGAELGSYVRLNAHANYAPAGRPWSLALRIYNVFDEHHRDPVGPELRQDSIRQDGREIRIQLGWAF
jgi:outer membrane receptor protein involved in Fe transport